MKVKNGGIKGEDEFYIILTMKIGKDEIKRLMKRGAKDQRITRHSTWENVKRQVPFNEIYKKTCKSFLS